MRNLHDIPREIPARRNHAVQIYPRNGDWYMMDPALGTATTDFTINFTTNVTNDWWDRPITALNNLRITDGAV